MQSVKLSRDHFHVDTHYTAGQVVTLPDDIAASLIKGGGGEASDKAAVNADANPIHDAVAPLVENADPLHAARAMSMNTPEYPALVAIADVVVNNQSKSKTTRAKPGDVIGLDVSPGSPITVPSTTPVIDGVIQPSPEAGGEKAKKDK